MALIRFEVVPELKNKADVFKSIDRANEILIELRQILYKLESSGIKLVIKGSPSDSEPNGEDN